MPIARKLDRQVQAAPLPGVRRTAAATPESEGAGVALARGEVGRAVAGIGQTVAGAGMKLLSMDLDARLREEQKARRQADELAILAYGNQLAGWENENLHNPQTGALAKKGQAAFALPEEVDRAFRQYADEQAQVLITPEQQLGAERIRSDRRERIALTVRRHVDREFQTYTAEQLQANVDLAVESAQHNAMDPGLVRRDIERGVAAQRSLGTYLGWSPEKIAVQVAEFKSAVHLGVIDRLLADQQTRAAQIYFEEAEGDIAGDKLDDVKRALRAGSVKGEAQKQFDAILAAGGTYNEQLTKARAIRDPDVRDAVETFVDQEQARRDRIEREQDEATSRTMYDQLEKNGGNIRAIMGTRGWSQLDGNQRRSLQIYAEALTSATTMQTDQKALYGLIELARDDPKAFVHANLWDFRGRLSRSDFEQMARLQLSMKQGAKDADEQLSNWSTPQQMFERAAASIKVEPKSKEGLALWKRFMSMGTTEEKLRGRKLSDEEMTRILDRLILALPNPKGFWNPFVSNDRRGFDLTIDDVPQAQRPLIVDALRKAGVPVMDDTILDTYLRYLEGQAK